MSTSMVVWVLGAVIALTALTLFVIVLTFEYYQEEKFIKKEKHEGRID